MKNPTLKNLTFGILTLCAVTGHAQLIKNGDMSLNAYAPGGNHCSFDALDLGWAVKSQNNLDFDEVPGKIAWSGTTKTLLEDSLAQVNSVTSETGTTLTLSFEWTPSATATSTNTSLDYQVVGWVTNGTAAPVDADIFFNNINGDTKKVSSLSDKADVVDLLTGTNLGTGTPTPTFGTVAGVAGVATNAQIEINLAGYPINNVADYDYIGVRFAINGDQADLSATNSTLDDVALTANTATNPPSFEDNFFTDTIHLVSSTVDLVADYSSYGADGTDTNDDSVALQQAIDDMTALPNGGKITIPSGTFHLRGLLMKSNVHLEVDPGATLKLYSPTNNGTVFSFGLSGSGSDALVTISNVSIRASSGRFNVDFTDVPPNPTTKAALVNCKNVGNFMIADINIVENYTRLSSLTFNLAEYGGQYFRPNNGVVKNIDNLYGHYGYGLVQVQCANNILFTNLTGTGGVTLRLESGAGDVADAPPDINIDEIYARHITITNGHYALMMGSHTRQNGHVDADGIYAVSSLRAATCGLGFATAEEEAAGLAPGRFAASSIVKNVHAVYGDSGAGYKWKNLRSAPPQIRHLISTNAYWWDTVSQQIYPGPSIGAAQNSDPDITFSNVTQSGFLYQPKALLTGEPWEDLEASFDNLYKGCNPITVDGVTLSQNSLSLNVAKSAALGATISPTNATDQDVNWITDNSDVASVSADGIVTAVGAGTCTITARAVDWGWFDTCAVTVDGGGGGTWTGLLSDDFETGWGNWVAGATNDVFLSTNNAIGAQCVNLQDDTSTAYMELTAPLDLSSYSRLKLGFSLVSAGFGYGHHLVVEYSGNGSTWSEVKRFKGDFDFDNGDREELAVILDGDTYNFTSNAIIRIRCDAAGDGNDAYVDNVVVTAFAQSGWGNFVNDFGLDALSTEDTDGDGLSDLGEYALGGDPTNSASTGNAPALEYGGGDMVTFSHWQVNGSNPGMSYLAEWTDSLSTGSWQTAWVTQTNTPTGNPDYSEAAQQVYGGTNDHLFFRLQIFQ